MFRILTIIAMSATVVALLGHFLVLGPKHPEIRREPRSVKRFSLWERFVHALTVVGFCTLGVTGFWAVAWTGQPLSGWWLLSHWVAAPLFALGATLMVATWCEFGVFEGHDWFWATVLGGYLGWPDHVPAGRFNAGQKAYFWSIGALGVLVILSGLGRMAPVFGADGQAVVLWVHRFSALFLVLSVIMHLYLGTLANPGTVLCMLSGYVSSKWASHHHSVWWERLANGGKKNT